MSGKLASFARKGSRAERVADMLLTAFGVCTPVRHEDDYGVDFHCELGDEHEGGYVTYHSPFILQIKNGLDLGILYGDQKPDKWKYESVAWLFQNKVPFLLGAVDVEATKLFIYDTSGLWQLYSEIGSGASQIELHAKRHPLGERRENITRIPLENWSPGAGDGYRYVIDIGNPIIEIENRDLDSQALLNGKRAILSKIIRLEQKNIFNRELGLKIFVEIKQTYPPGHNFEIGMKFADNAQFVVEDVLKEMHDGLVSILMRWNAEGNTEACEALKYILKYAPRTRAAEALYNSNPDLFDYLAPKKK
jgi:hypothetical protein